MLNDRESLLKLYSLGIVVNTKPDGSDMIDVLPVEELPTIKGPVSSFKPEFKSKLPDAQGKAQSDTVTAGSTLQAKWLPLCQSNRMTAPDVVKNETVIIFRYGDTDKYYWSPLFREPGIRRLEHVIYAYGDLTAPLTEFDDNSSYWVKISTKEKSVHLHTSNSNGEPFIYDISLNTAVGVFKLTDNVGNSITLSSADKKINLTNGAGSFLDITDANISMNAPGNILIQAGGNVSINAGNNSTVTGGIGASVSGGQYTSMEAPSFNINSPDVNIN